MFSFSRLAIQHAFCFDGVGGFPVALIGASEMEMLGKASTALRPNDVTKI